MKDEKLLIEISNSLKIIVWSYLRDLHNKNKDVIEKIKKSKTKKQVWDLCDGNHCREDIAIELQKDPTTIGDHLKPMFEENIIFVKAKGNKKMIISLDILVANIFDSIDWEIKSEI